jgi:hypothetical protein
MALPSAGNPISFKDINEEIGNTGNAELDLKTAAETFGDTEPFGMNELLGLSSARLQLTIKYLVQAEQGESNVDVGWISTAGSVAASKGELVLCAEAAAPADDLRANGLSLSVDTETTDFNSDGTVSNGDTLFNSNSGATLSSRRPDGGMVNQETFLCETTQNNIFQVNSSGVISNVRSRTPDVPTKPTLVADSGTQITVTIPTTNTAVTREFKLQRSIDGGSFSDRATFVPSDSGSIDDTSIGTTFVDDSGLSAGDVVKYQVRGQNAFANSAFSTESDTVTTPSPSTAWSNVPTDFNLHILDADSSLDDSDVSAVKTINLANASGNTSISCQQPTNGLVEFKVAASTSGDPGVAGTANSGTGFGSSITVAAGTTYYLRFFLGDNKNDTEGGQSAQDRTVTFTNNGVSNTDLDVNIRFNEF